MIENSKDWVAQPWSLKENEMLLNFDGAASQ